MPLSRARLLPAAVSAFYRAYPDVRINIVEGPFQELIEPLRDGELDLMIGALRDPSPGEDVMQQPLFDDRPVVLGRVGPTSECTYMLASGSRASLMTRNSPIADNTNASIKLARDTTQETVSAFTDKKVEDIPGIGKAAFFVPGVNQLNVFIDDKRFIILTVSSAPN